MNPTIAFVGGGNMASSLVGGLLRSGHPATGIRVAETDPDRAESLRTRFEVTVRGKAQDIVAGADTLVLAVKPQQMKAALEGLQPDPGTCCVSIAAGITLASLQTLLGSSLHYVRCMPNTPALLGCGISGLFAEDSVPEAARQRAEHILRAAGEVCWVQRESDLDAVTAVSGSGPAYVFLLVEAMREAGESLGLPADVSARLAAQTCIGAARMIESGDVDVTQLRTQVTSPGGTTEAAIQSLEQAGLRSIFKQALSAAAARSAELGRSS